MKFSEEVKSALGNLIDEMSLNLLEFTLNPRKNFANILIILSTVHLILHLIKEDLKSDAFKYLFETFIEQYSNNPRLFNSYRLIVCDGSEINISHNRKD